MGKYWYGASAAMILVGEMECREGCVERVAKADDLAALKWESGAGVSLPSSNRGLSIAAESGCR